MNDTDHAPGEDFNQLAPLLPPLLRNYARALLADCSELWADDISELEEVS